jgi:hypothetical protein
MNLNKHVLKIENYHELESLNLTDFPLATDFSIKMSEAFDFGKHLWFQSETYGSLTTFPWWDKVNIDMQKQPDDFNLLGTFENPHDDLEQGWQILIFEKDNFVYIMQGDEPRTKEFSIWYKVTKEKYLEEWRKIVREAKENSYETDSLEFALQNPLKIEILHFDSKWWSKLSSEIGKFKNLKKLYLEGNSLESLPDEIGELTNLEYLGLSGSSLKSLPKAFSNLKKLKRLLLNHNQLKEFPKEITELTNLTVLDLSHNEIPSIPEEIGNLTNLEDLYLGYNKIASIPKSINKVTKLKQVDITNNEIKVIAKELFDLKNIRQFYLDSNMIEILPEEISNLAVLHDFGLTNNKLKKLPESLIETKGLRMIIGNNKFEKSYLENLDKEFPNITFVK